MRLRSCPTNAFSTDRSARWIRVCASIQKGGDGYLKESDEEEEAVGVATELLKQEARQKGEGVIFGRRHPVAAEALAERLDADGAQLQATLVRRLRGGRRPVVLLLCNSHQVTDDTLEQISPPPFRTHRGHPLPTATGGDGESTTAPAKSPDGTLTLSLYFTPSPFPSRKLDGAGVEFSFPTRETGQ